MTKYECVNCKCQMINKQYFIQNFPIFFSALLLLQRMWKIEKKRNEMLYDSKMSCKWL